MARASTPKSGAKIDSKIPIARMHATMKAPMRHSRRPATGMADAG
jgi:hypothetical protein